MRVLPGVVVSAGRRRLSGAGLILLAAAQQLTFRIDHASDADVARLETCLEKFPGVAGVTLQDSSDAGG
jgi:hypothetical protein